MKINMVRCVLTEGDGKGVGQAVRAIWKNDVQNIKKEFRDDQERNG